MALSAAPVYPVPDSPIAPVVEAAFVLLSMGLQGEGIGAFVAGSDYRTESSCFDHRLGVVVAS